jgi:hypothetical protein
LSGGFNDNEFNDRSNHLLTNWESYLAPAIGDLLPLSAASLMRTAGIIEMLVGILILTNWTRIGAYVASAWLLLIALTLLLTGSHLDVAVRDVAMAVGAWTLARITEIRHPAQSPVPARSIGSSASAEA